MGDETDATGFAPVSDAARFAARRRDVAVPPGHLLVFYERLAHRVASRKAPAAGVVRQFFGWRSSAASFLGGRRGAAHSRSEALARRGKAE